ncbi:Vitellogenic carboxypeptidase [Eumeta japonica]|uniref:Carboxypeptidase n=1 Tax=Eumeta variegata TaxID=151549 RepID=A0A4C1U2K1_EUMVA|nr:Vitellogenic carboxypeptidase [Eumeta japonica]
MFIPIIVFVLLTSSVHTKVTVNANLHNLIHNIVAFNEKAKATIKHTTDNNVTIAYNKIRDYAVKSDFNEITNNSIDSDTTANRSVSDNGTALILTPLIEQEKYAEARTTCRVDSTYFLGIESYSGYLTVNKTYNSNLFFWYFPSTQGAVNGTPWIIWLQGGPGASSMTGLFDEIGPFTFEPQKGLKRNPNTWAVNHSLLFIDNPVGTGFSFTDSTSGFTKDMTTYSSHLYSALDQFLTIFPELRRAPLYIAGESYGGKYAPSLAMEIHKRKLASEIDLNLQGLIMGNAYIDPQAITHLTRTFYNFGLIDDAQKKIVEPLEESFRGDIAANRSVAAKSKWNYLVTALILLSYQRHAYNFLKDDMSVGKYSVLFARPEIRRAIHVGNINFRMVNLTVNSELAPEFLSSARPLMETLLEHYRVLAYCGQLDQMMACTMSSESYGRWRWSGAGEFHNATRYPFLHEGKVAGYHKSGGRLTEVVVRGAGHMVPMDAGGAAQALVAAFTRDIPISKPNFVIATDTLKSFIKNGTNSIYL